MLLFLNNGRCYTFTREDILRMGGLMEFEKCRPTLSRVMSLAEVAEVIFPKFPKKEPLMVA